jgi:hypothetical protein
MRSSWLPMRAETIAPAGIPVAKICRTLPAAAGVPGAFTMLSWFSTPLANADGQAGASTTVVGELLTPSAVTTSTAEVLLSTCKGT